jgi:hypothetical protein
MPIDMFNIEYATEKIWGKDLFVFVNHKTAVLCWALLKAKNGLSDVITFDSQGNYSGGYVTQGNCNTLADLPMEQNVFGSRQSKDNKVGLFTKYKEFQEWNPLDANLNNKLIRDDKKFLKCNNDNIADIAFMKNIVKNIDNYHIEVQGKLNAGICDDFEGGLHTFRMRPISEFEQPKDRFILDIDLDFFAVLRYKRKMVSDKRVRRILVELKKLGESKSCIGITVALEPDCCGSIHNSLKICEQMSEIFEKKAIFSSARRLLKSSIIN